MVAFVAVFDVTVKLRTPLNVLSRSSVSWKFFNGTSPMLTPSIRMVTVKLVPLGTRDVTCLVTSRAGDSRVTPTGVVAEAVRFFEAGVFAVAVAALVKLTVALPFRLTVAVKQIGR